MCASSSKLKRLKRDKSKVKDGKRKCINAQNNSELTDSLRNNIKNKINYAITTNNSEVLINRILKWNNNVTSNLNTTKSLINSLIDKIEDDIREEEDRIRREEERKRREERKKAKDN